MSVDPKQGAEALRERIQEGERGGCERDRELLDHYAGEMVLRRESIGWHRQMKMLRHNTRISEHADAFLYEALVQYRDDDDTGAAKEAAKTLVEWIQGEYTAAETNRDYRVALRHLGKYATPEDDTIPDSVSWISGKTPANYNPTPDSADMLDYEDDVLPMIEATANHRDAALIALQFEAGLRGGELFDLRVGDVTDADHSLKLRVDGKRGPHDVHLIQAVPYVQQWLSAHPGDSDDFLWTKLRDPERLSYQRFLQIFKEAAGRVDVSKEVTPTNFRKSNAYWLAEQDKAQAFIEDRQGRSRGSPVISRYVARFSGETAETKYAEMHGIEVDADATEEPDPPVTCPRCGNQTPRERDFCIHCRQVLDFESKQLLETVSERITEAADSADDPEEEVRLLQAEVTLRQHPGSVDSELLHDLASKLETND